MHDGDRHRGGRRVAFAGVGLFFWGNGVSIAGAIICSPFAPLALFFTATIAILVAAVVPVLGAFAGRTVQDFVNDQQKPLSAPTRVPVARTHRVQHAMAF